MAERNRRLTLPSLARHRGHSSVLSDGAGLYTVSLHVGQFRYANLSSSRAAGAPGVSLARQVSPFR
jgi:hypothetical protein